MSDIIQNGKEGTFSLLRQKHIVRQIWISALANLLQAMQGFVIAMSSIMIPQLLNPQHENELALTESEATWFASLYCIGYLSGSFVGAFQGNYFGQRVSLIIDCCTSSMGLLLVGFAPSFEYLIVGRLLCGHASASGTVTIPLYTSEISAPEIRGITGSFLLNFYLGGYCLTIILGSLVFWRYTMITLVAFPIFSGIFLIFAPNSPVWLLQNGKDEEAFKSLLYFRGDELKVSEEIAEIKLSLQECQSKVEKKESEKAQIIQKLTRFKAPEFWKPFLICCVLTAGFVEWCGLGPIAFYMVTFVEKSGIPLDPYLAACINTVGRATFGLVSTKWLGKYPRRSVYLICLSLMAVGTGIIAIYHYLLNNEYFIYFKIEDHFVTWIPAFGYFLTSFSYSSGYLQISYMIQGEVFPSDVKSFGSGLVCFIDGISMFFSAKMALTLLNCLGVALYFTYSTVMIILCFLFSFFFLPETQGKTLYQIQNELKKSDS